MDKRYQVFISSTFLDLQHERLKVQQAVMELECIPAGMEAFPAIDEEQFAFIKKVIDDCDYYLLVIGGRYGSVSDAGLSYTEMEYDYAVSKGIKVIVFLHKDPSSLPANKTDQSDKLKKKLLAFRKKVSKDRLIRFWNNADELQGLVSTSLSKTMRSYPAIGWVRGNTVPNSEVYKELNDLRKENDTLKQVVYAQSQFVDTHKIAGLDDSILIGMHSDFSRSSPQKIETTWGDMFYRIAPILMVHAPEKAVRRILSEYLLNRVGNVEHKQFYEIDARSMTAIRIQFRALDLVNLYSGEEDSAKTLIWSLTPTGERLLVIDRASRRADE